MSEKILVTRSSMPSYEEYCEEIKELWSTHWLTNMGTKHKQLQSELEKYMGVSHVTLYTNGHLALEGALNGLNLKAGSEVITTPFTFVSTTNAIVRSGLKPVFCDINTDDYTIDVTKIEELITDKTVAILPIHVYGNICKVNEIENIAKKYNLKVIYDAAHAFGVQYCNKSVASFGDVTMFSFHATKVYNTIEGGAICYSDDGLQQVFNDQKNFGIRGPEECEFIGGNAKMNEFQAAMGICNLRHLDQEINKRKIIVERYKENLEGIHGIKLCDIPENVKSNYAYLPLVFDEKVFKGGRDKVMQELDKNNYGARKYFYPLTSDLACYAGYNKGNTPIARSIAQRVLTVPLYADLSLENVDEICNIIKKCAE